MARKIQPFMEIGRPAGHNLLLIVRHFPARDREKTRDPLRSSRTRPRGGEKSIEIVAGLVFIA